MVLAPLFCSVFIPNLFIAFKKRAGALFRSFGSRGPLLRPRRKTQPSVVIGVRPGALFGQNGPGIRDGVHIFKSIAFSIYSKNHDVRRVSRSLGGSWALSGHPLGGARGPNNQTKVTATLRPVFGRVLRLRAGGQWSTRLASLGVQNCSKMMVVVFSSCRGVSKKAPRKGGAAPRRGGAQNLRK